MSPPTFHAAIVENMHNGIVRIRGKEKTDIEIAGKLTFKLFFGFGCIATVIISVLNYSQLDSNELSFILQEAAFILIFFTIMGLIPYLLLTYGVNILRVVSGHHKLWWDDFTFDGESVKSRMYKFKASDIAFVESRTQKFPENDSWHYASIMKSNGVEIGRVMVAYRDKKKMVKYLSDLFETS